MEHPSLVEGDIARDAWADPSPFAIPHSTAVLPQINSEGPVRFLLVSGEKDNGRWGIVGAFWLSDDESRGGFLLSPSALWHGKEMVRSYRSALSRGWSDAQIFAYWSDQTGILATYMIDPRREAETLSAVGRIVGTI